jgi:hypothetical protein
LTKAEQEYTRSLLSCPTVTQVWQSWLNTGAVPGLDQVVQGKQWSQVYPQVNPQVESLLKVLTAKK